MAHPSHVVVHHAEDGPAGGSTVVFVNSLGSTLEMWEPQARALAAHHRVVRFDLRGHGRSPVPPGPYALDDLGADVLALMDRLEIERASLCGLSLGGMVAMWTAIAAPQRVDRLALCCTSAALGPPEAWRERAALVRSSGTEAVADAVVGRWLTPGFAAEHPDERARLRAMIAATPAEGYAGCCAAIERMDLERHLHRITAPTLVVAGADDPATPPDHAQRIAAAIPGARAHVVDGAAHLANVEQPARVTALLAAHLR
ncbi:MAG TPA: 3-oxoadipate enol-lactonase [Capillimicrobium sp.]|jgi:3-oxoadipate enol-lactonase